MDAPISNILTVDLEDWYQGVALYAGESTAGQVDRTAFRRGLDRLLALLARHSARATFFVLGMTVEADIGVLDELTAAGHEIATHGYGHRHLWRQTTAEFAEDLRRGLGILRERVGTPILGYRAPQFSVPRDRREEFFATLAAAGIKYDSSVFPFRGPRYGLPDFPPGVTTVQMPTGPIVEVPLSIRRVLGRAMPVSGGGYWRVLPAAFTRSNIRWLNRRGLPMVTYMHNYEFDPERLRSAKAGLTGVARRLRVDFVQNLRRRTMPGKLAELLDRFRFTTMVDFLRKGGYLPQAG
jgi:polysaccharide deacetylase family protein (PEP-CTERM system associated)